MKVKDLMSLDVKSVGPEATLSQAAVLMRDNDTGCIPVCENDRLVGLITDRDIAIRAVASGANPSTAKVGQFMTRGITWVRENADVEEASRLMEEKQIRRLAVLNEKHRLVGIVSLGDLALETQDRRLSGEILERVSMHTQPVH